MDSAESLVCLSAEIVNLSVADALAITGAAALLMGSAWLFRSVIAYIWKR